MKKYKNILLTLLISLGIVLQIPNVYAEDETDEETEVVDVSEVDLSRINIDDEFSVEHADNTYVYRVSEMDTDKIYIQKSNKLDIEHFEVNVYEEGSNEVLTSRKFVKLEDLCNEGYAETEDGDDINLCQATKYEIKKKSGRDSVISISRQYTNTISDTVKKVENGKTTYEGINREVHYITETKLGTDEFESKLYLSDGSDEEFDLDEIDCNGTNEICYTFGGSESKNDNLSKKGVLTGDVETLVDENGDIYVSLRFLSEALGARVDWLPQEDKDYDKVLIRFYEDEEYCKELNVEFDIENANFEKMYTIFKNALSGSKDISFNLKYTYWDGSDTEEEKIEWKKLFLGGYAANNGYVYWDYEQKKILFQYDASKSDETLNVDFQEICPSENYDSNGQLTTLDECMEVMGIIRYYGVPIPIELLREENDTCDFYDDNDEDTYEGDTSDYDYDDEDEDNEDEEDSDVVYLIGDVHVANIEEMYSDEDIEYINVSELSKFEKKLNSLSDNLDEETNYTFIFNIGNTEIEKEKSLEELNKGSVNNVRKSLKALAGDYAEVYADFYETIEENNINAELYIIPNTPIKNEKTDDNFTENFWDYLKSELRDNDIYSYFNIIDIKNIDFEYSGNNDLEYTDEVYEELFDEIDDEIGLK
ncbi:MAG: hypothetical protein IJO32_02220 [Bacilli bacterium]|nr:hypothetical protein [Bacilli bacterium]